MTKHIFVTGGVVSSLGKGITAASLGRLLKSRGYHVIMQKMDPYLNVDPGTMSPFQHGEVFVTDDGHEADLDLGHYERFIDENLTRDSNFTQGSIYQELISKERKGDFGGGTVQVIPHVTNAIKDRLRRLSKETNPDFIITEIGGTVGDIESLPFIEAARQFRKEKGIDDVCFIHVTLVPYIPAAHEVKTKPTQHSVKELRSMGVQPDFIVCRSDHEVDEETRAKIALFCDVEPQEVVAANDAASIYQVPMSLLDQNLDVMVLDRLGCEVHDIDLNEWEQTVERSQNLSDSIDIAIVGKYISLPDAYLSVCEALDHAGTYNDRKVNLRWINGDTVDEEGIADELKGADGIMVPGGFGERGVRGKLAAVKYARENNIPFLGIGLGLQVALCETARNVAGLKEANSTEFDPDTSCPVVDLPPEERGGDRFSSTMRLGSYPCVVAPGTKVHDAYGEDRIEERHRHRYEVNNDYREELAKAGIVFSGVSPNDEFVEMIEREDHPFFVATLGHPEFKSRPTRPQPLFREFVRAAIAHRG